LNQWLIREKSQDNKDSIVFVGKGKRPKAGEWARDSRHVEIVIDPSKVLMRHGEHRGHELVDSSNPNPINPSNTINSSNSYVRNLRNI